MAEPLSISILTRKRDEIRDTIAAYETRLRQAQADLAHVDAALRLFAATGEPMDFPAYVDLNRVLRRGETTKLCFEALASDGPMDTRQLTERVMKAKGLDFGDKVLRGGLTSRFLSTQHPCAENHKSHSMSHIHCGYERAERDPGAAGNSTRGFSKRSRRSR
jgi:hypothetical protein